MNWRVGEGGRHDCGVPDKGTEREERGKGILTERKVWSEVAKGAAFLEHHAVELGSKAHEEEQQE